MTSRPLGKLKPQPLDLRNTPVIISRTVQFDRILKPTGKIIRENDPFRKENEQEESKKQEKLLNGQNTFSGKKPQTREKREKREIMNVTYRCFGCCIT